MNHNVYIALGTNLGNREKNLRSALNAFAPDVQIVAESKVYQTAPWGFDDQPNFLNQVIQGTTHFSPDHLLAFLKDIETNMGRTATFRNGPRVIDLDILIYGDLVIEKPDLIIPHPRLHERAFVLIPLADLSPGFRHPVLGHTVKEMLADVDQDGVDVLTG